MKNLKILMAITALLLFSSCNEILEDVQPSTSMAGELVLTTPEGVESARAAMYSALRASTVYTTQYLIGPGAIADESRMRDGASRTLFNDVVGTHGTSHLTSYNTSYGIILRTNLIIGAVEEGILPQDQLDQYKGEAYALRAFTYHNLVRTYGYEPGNESMGPEANWDLGVVLRTEPTLEISNVDNRPRYTVDEIYDQIFDDLDQAKQLLSGVNSDKTFITEAFVDGLRARVNLYAGNWAEAVTFAQEAIDNSGLSLQDTEAGIADMFYETKGNHPEAIWKMVIHPNTEQIGGSNVNEGMAAYTSQQWVAQIPTQFVLDLYDTNDFRLSGWFMECYDRAADEPKAGCDAVNDDGLSTSKWNGDNGNHSDDIPYLRLSEMYLIWAEAAAKDAQNPSAGAAPLQELKDARNAGSIPAAALADLDSFEDEILDERVRELNFEGHRYWDLKRLGRHVRNPDGSIKIRNDSYRMLAPIGNSNLNSNPELVENPGY